MNALDRAIEKAGGVGKLASSIGVGQTTVSNWRARGTLIDAIFCVRIERCYGVTRQELRPNDYWEIWTDLTPPNKEGADA